MALVADEPLFLLRMDTDIALASLASGRAVPMGAEYRRGIHAMLLLVVRGSVPRGVCRDPHFRYKCASPRLRAELPLFGLHWNTEDIVLSKLDTLLKGQQ